MKLRPLELAIVVAGVVTSLLLLTDVWPGLRGPEEWRWGRRLLESPAPLLLSCAIFLATVGLAVRARRAPRAWDAFPVAALVFAQMLALTAAEPGGLSNLRRRVLDPSFTSYHTIATRIESPSRFIREYHDMQESFPVHGPSQPPGRVLFFYAANQLAGSPERGATLAAFILLVAGALCVLPLAVIAGGRGDAHAIGAALLLFACVPSILLFTPQTDHIILLLTMFAAALAIEAIRRAASRAAPVLAAAAGAIAGISLFVSMTAAAALGAWGIALGVTRFMARDPSRPCPPISRHLLLASCAALGLLFALAIPAALGMNWPAVVRECFEGAHRVQVLIFARSYSTWVGWNLVDFALFLGPPLALATVASIRTPFAIALFAALAILDLSGSILGETGRIWMFLMPLAVLAAATSPAMRPRRSLLLLAATQFLVLLSMRLVLNVPG